ncbi:MAG: phytoene desaturase family protein [Myxococcota bacterium]
MTRTIVVGAGLGGLSAAIELQAAGHNVLVLEAASEPGGKAGVAHHEGVTFDTGPSVLTMPDVFESVFRTAGSSLADEVELLNAQEFVYRWPDQQQVTFYPDKHRTLASIQEVFGSRAREEFNGFLEYAETIWSAAAPHFVYGSAPDITTMFKLGPKAFKMLPKVDGLRSMRRAIRSRIKNPQLRNICERYATYNGSDPRQAPATLNCVAHVELGMGWHGVRGGVAAVVDALTSCAERLGVEFRYHARVARILHDRSVAGVRLESGENFAARQVVVNADVAHLIRDLLPAKTSLEPREPSMSGYTMVVKARRRDRPAHQVLFPHDYDAEFSDIFDEDRPPSDPTLYLCAQEKAHGRVGWDRHEPIFVMANAPAEPSTGARESRAWKRIRTTVWRRLVASGLVDKSDEIVWERTPTDLAARFPGSRGSIYGNASNSRTAAFQRPANRVKEVPGLYLASGSAHPGGGMPLCVLSGRAAAICAQEDAAGRLRAVG